jgi:hypothetical protein
MYDEPDLELTAEEERAIRSLERLAKKWPPSLMLFGVSGSLLVRRVPGDGKGGGKRYTVTEIIGIQCDGGDGGDDY